MDKRKVARELVRLAKSLTAMPNWDDMADAYLNEGLGQYRGRRWLDLFNSVLTREERKAISLAWREMNPGWFQKPDGLTKDIVEDVFREKVHGF